MAGWLDRLGGLFTTPPVPVADAKTHLHQLAALPAAARIAEAAELATKPGTDLRAVAAALLPKEQRAVLDRVDAKTQIKLVEAGFAQMVEMSSDGQTFLGNAALIVAMKKSPVPEGIREFVDKHAFEGRIHAVRQGRVALRFEETPEVERALAKLDRAQLQTLRDVLVNKPPHPELKTMKRHAALKGQPTVAKLMAILAGDPLGLNADSAESTTAPLFKRMFLPNTPVRVKRTGGKIEDDWKIQARSPDGNIVVSNGAGYFKTVSPTNLLLQTPSLVPLETPVAVERNAGGVDGGWHVAEHMDDGLVKVRKPGFSKTPTISNLLATNPDLIAPPVVHGVAGQIFAEGREITVRRGDGSYKEAGWTIGAYLPDSGKIIVTKGRLHKRVRARDVLVDNPELIPVGIELNTPRTAGWVEDGWQAFGGTDDGRLRMVNGRGEWKAIPTEELVELNHELLLRPADATQPKLSGNEARAVPGLGLDQAEHFQIANRIEGGQMIHDGYLDGGRGQRFDSGAVRATREVMVVDRKRDKSLVKMLAWARQIQTLPEAERLQVLTRYVDDHFRPTKGNAVDAANRLGDDYLSREVLLGDAAQLGGGGACRHRALLFKVLGDEAGLDVALVRGHMGTASGQQGGHAWNEVKLQSGERKMVDVMNPTRRGSAYEFPALRASALGADVYMDAAGNELYGA